MTQQIRQNAYLVASGTGTIYPTVFFDRSPTSNDLNYPIGQRWINESISDPVTIMGASQATSCVITADNSFVPGQIVYISGVGGMIELNNQYWLITAANATTFTIFVDSTGFGVYTSGGTATAQEPEEYILLGIDTRQNTRHAQWALIAAPQAGGGGSGTLSSLTADDSTVAVPTAGGTITVSGGSTGLTTTASGSTLSALGTLNVAHGGTSSTTLTAHNVLIGEGTAAVGFAAPSATSGVPLVSTGAAADPAFGTAVVAGGGTGATSFANNNAVVLTGASGTAALTSLANGSASQVLTISGGVPTWANPYASPISAFRATLSTRTANNITGDGTTYTVIFDSELFDVGSNYDNTTGIFTAPVTGKYLFNTNVTFFNVTTQTSGIINFTGSVNSSATMILNPSTTVDAATEMSLSGSFFVSMTAGDTMQVNVKLSGGAKTVAIEGNNGTAAGLTAFEGFLVF